MILDPFQGKSIPVHLWPILSNSKLSLSCRRHTAKVKDLSVGTFSFSFVCLVWMAPCYAMCLSGTTLQLSSFYRKKERSGGTVDWLSNIQTTNLFGPFCQLDTHTQFSFNVVNIFPFIATSRLNKITFQSGQCYLYIVREVWFYQIWIQLHI
mgnify:CR=1 FL=1